MILVIAGTMRLSLKPWCLLRLKFNIRDVLPDRVPVLLKIVVAYRVMLISYKCLASLNMKIMTLWATGLKR